jgi:hypothetical protein
MRGRSADDDDAGAAAAAASLTLGSADEQKAEGAGRWLQRV